MAETRSTYPQGTHAHAGRRAQTRQKLTEQEFPRSSDTWGVLSNTAYSGNLAFLWCRLEKKRCQAVHSLQNCSTEGACHYQTACCCTD